MRIGVSTAQTGSFASRDGLIATAAVVEQCGFHTMWVVDRLLAANDPTSPYPGTPTGKLPPEFARAFDPLSTLAFLAATTSTVRLGTSVLVAPWYRPALLGRQLAAIDVLSDGRLTVGLGSGWSQDEYAAAGVLMADRAVALEECLDVLFAMWGRDPVTYDGRTVRLSDASMGPKPVQQPRPAVLLAGTSESVLARVGRRADGWNPSALPNDRIQTLWGRAREFAAEAGRDPQELSLTVRTRGFVTLTSAFAFVVEERELCDELDELATLGADEVILSLPLHGPAGQVTDIYHSVAAAVGHRLGRDAGPSTQG